MTDTTDTAQHSPGDLLLFWDGKPAGEVAASETFKCGIPIPTKGHRYEALCRIHAVEKGYIW